jgi:hypothetical protein
MSDNNKLGKIATPLGNPEEFFDDWDDLEVDKAYFEEFVGKKVQELLDKKIIDIDDVVHIFGGVYVLPPRPGQPKFNIRALIKYCEAKGINTDQIADEELDMFVINREELAKPYENGTLKISESLPYDYDDFHKELGIPDKKSPEEIWKLIQGYIRCAEENKKEAELTFDAQVEAITKADKGEM